MEVNISEKTVFHFHVRLLSKDPADETDTFWIEVSVLEHDSLTAKEILQIKKNGKLLALQSGEFGGFQYWRWNGIIYSISTSGESFTVWCSENALNRHLHRLFQLIGHRFFTESECMTVVDKEFVSGIAYA